MDDQERPFFRRFPLITALALFFAAALVGLFALGIYGTIWNFRRNLVLDAKGLRYTPSSRDAPLSRSVGALIGKFSDEVHSLALAQDCDQPEVLAQLQLFPELRELRIDDGDISAKEGALIAQLPSVKSLSFEGTKISREAWELLAPWAAQRNVTLTLGHTSASDEGLEIAARHKLSIGEVTLESGDISSKGIATLSAFPQLHTIHAQSAKLSPADWTVLASLPKLQNFTFDTANVYDEAMPLLAKLECLKPHPVLDLSESDIGDAGIEGLKQNSVFSHVCVGGSKITSAGVAMLGEIPNLSLISISDHRLDEKTIRSLSRSRMVTGLFLEDGAIDTDGCAALGEWQLIRMLSLTRMKISPEGARRMATGFKDRGWVTLNLASNELGDDGFAAVAQVNARELRLTDPTVGDRGLLALKDNPSLVVWELGESGATGEGLAALGEMKELRRVNLTGAIIDDHAIEWVSRQPVIEMLRLENMDFVETLDPNAPREPGKGRVSVSALIRALKGSTKLEIIHTSPNDPTRMREYVAAGVPLSSRYGYMSPRVSGGPAAGAMPSGTMALGGMPAGAISLGPMPAPPMPTPGKFGSHSAVLKLRAPPP